MWEKAGSGESVPLLSRTGRVSCSSLEHSQADSSCTTALALSNGRMLEVENDSVYELELLEKASRVPSATAGRVGIGDPCDS